MLKQKVREIINTLSMEASKTMKQEHSNKEGKSGNTNVLQDRRAAKEEPPLMPKEQVIQVDDFSQNQRLTMAACSTSSDQINQWANNLLLSLAPEEKLMLLFHARRGQKRPLPASFQEAEQEENKVKKCLKRSFSGCTDNPTRYDDNGSNNSCQNHNQNFNQSRANQIPLPSNIPATNPPHKYLPSQHQSSPGYHQPLPRIDPAHIASTTLSSPPALSSPAGGLKKSQTTTKTFSSIVTSLSGSASHASSRIGMASCETNKNQNTKPLQNSPFTFNSELTSTKSISPVDRANIASTCPSSRPAFPCPVSRLRKSQNTTVTASNSSAQPITSTAFSASLACYLTNMASPASSPIGLGSCKTTNKQNYIPSTISSITFNSQLSSTTISSPKPQLRSIPSNPTCQRNVLNLVGDTNGSQQNVRLRKQGNPSESHSSQSPTAGQEKSTIDRRLSFLREQTKCMTDMLDVLCQAQALISNNVPTRESSCELSSESNLETRDLLAESSRNAVLSERSEGRVPLNKSSFRACLLTKRASLMNNSLKVLSGENLEEECSRRLGQSASQKQSTKPHYPESNGQIGQLGAKHYIAEGKKKVEQINNTPEELRSSCKLSTGSLQDPSRHSSSQPFPGELDLTLGLRMPLASPSQVTTATDNTLSLTKATHHQNLPWMK